MDKKTLKLRVRRRKRVRRNIFGTNEKPRLCVYRSLNQIYAQIIDDVKGNTLVAVSSLSKDHSEEFKNTKGKIEKSKLVGKLIAEKALAANITRVVFDRNIFRYHGRVKAVADGAREGGLQI